MERETERPVICEFISSDSHGNEVFFFFLSEIALGVFEDNHPSDRPLPKLQGMSMLNPQILTMWGDRF